MRILLIKTSSMGDIIHTLPALTDAGKAHSDICFDWVVEDTFIDIPRWHPLVDQVIPVALRRWRKGIFTKETRREWQKLRQQLQNVHYDYILDAQGLVKSAFLTYFTNGLRVGLNWRSAREWLAAFFYQKKVRVNFYQHAVVRMRQLFSLALDYSLPNTAPDFQIDRAAFQVHPPKTKYIVLLHGTTWKSKLWPEEYWIKLANIAAYAGLSCKISGGSKEEMARAERIAKSATNVEVFPFLRIAEMATLLANATAAVAVDTGFGHLSAALAVPTVSLYGSTNADYTGALGPRSYQLSAKFPCAPCLKRECHYRQPSVVTPACYATLTPDEVWQQLITLTAN